MAAYYNENNAHAAAWLRRLIAKGKIADGVVDTRSIADVEPADLNGFDQVHLFAGIGGWSLALRLAGVPDTANVWTGSCPCQPFSTAGKRAGTGDERHLWPHMHRLISAIRPPVAFGEQVETAVKHDWLDVVFADLEAQDYTCGAAVLGAHSIGAPHIRQRLYWVAYSESAWRCQGREMEEGNCEASGRSGEVIRSEPWPDGAGSRSAMPVTGVLSSPDGFPDRVGLWHGYGNAIIPALAAEFILSSL